MSKISVIRRHPVRGTLAALAIAALATGAAVAVPAQAGPLVERSAASRAGCPTGWGSLPEASTRGGASAVTNVRTGRHACYDRLVVDLAGKGGTGYRVRYVKVATADGSGAPIRTRGGAVLQIVVTAPAYDAAGRPTYRFTNQKELSTVAGYSTFRQVAWGGSFEGQTTLALGVRARLPFRTFVLTGPGSNSRIVIDVAHHW
ncbi:AMIN-like domain-containing (lipo)protein [Kribbella ginsengisoli]|uniref:AMIN-like domain-containing protein n=1 Tax=Kribbella ginsengisoli TaxID=363865 RepID=A0ABP6YGM2_9ACTN